MTPVPKNLNKKQVLAWRRLMAIKHFSAPVAAKMAKSGRRFLP